MLTFLIFSFFFICNLHIPILLSKKIIFKFQVNLLTNLYMKHIEIAKNVALKYVSMD